jgi:cytochrome P450
VKDGHDHETSNRDWRKWRVRGVVGQSQIATYIFQQLRKHTSLASFLEMDHFARWVFAIVGKQLAAPKPEKSSQEPLANMTEDLKLLAQKKPEWKAAWTSQMVVISALAGHNTSLSAALSVFANISTRPDVHARIVEELKLANLSNPPKYSDIAALPYFEACIKEALRLYPAVCLTIPRKAPAGGATIDGYTVPAGTTVGTNPYVVHRNPDIFGADAEVYNPDRWLGPDEEHIRLMQQNLLTWGGRSRACPGQYLAQFMLVKMLATLFMTFDIGIEWDRTKAMSGSPVTWVLGLTATFDEKKQG